MSKSYQDNRKILAERIKSESPKVPIQEVRIVQKSSQKENESHLNFWLPSQLMDEIKFLSIKQKKSIKKIGIEALTDFIEKNRNSI